MAVMGAFSVVTGGINSAAFTWFMDKTGIVQNLAKTVSPSLKGAFLFEAINRSIALTSSSLNERVKKALDSGGIWLRQGNGCPSSGLCSSFSLCCCKILQCLLWIKDYK